MVINVYYLWTSWTDWTDSDVWFQLNNESRSITWKKTHRYSRWRSSSMVWATPFGWQGKLSPQLKLNSAGTGCAEFKDRIFAWKTFIINHHESCENADLLSKFCTFGVVLGQPQVAHCEFRDASQRDERRKEVSLQVVFPPGSGGKAS